MILKHILVKDKKYLHVFAFFLVSDCTNDLQHGLASSSLVFLGTGANVEGLLLLENATLPVTKQFAVSI